MMNQTACDKMTIALENNKQVMIFVHSRKETSRTAEAMRDLCGKNGTTNLLDNFNHEQFSVWKRAVEKSRSIELQQLFYQGIFLYFILFYFILFYQGIVTRKYFLYINYIYLYRYYCHFCCSFLS